jgi:hypothetical protein
MGKTLLLNGLQGFLVSGAQYQACLFFCQLYSQFCSQPGGGTCYPNYLTCKMLHTYKDKEPADTPVNSFLFFGNKYFKDKEPADTRANSFLFWATNCFKDKEPADTPANSFLFLGNKYLS